MKKLVAAVAVVATHPAHADAARIGGGEESLPECEVGDRLVREPVPSDGDAQTFSTSAPCAAGSSQAFTVIASRL